MDGGRKGLFPGLSKPFGRGCGRGMGLGDEMNGIDRVGGMSGDTMVILWYVISYGNTVSLDCM